MTLIALTVNHGYPIMMADLLISSPKSDGAIEIPTFVKGTGKMFANMKQSKPCGLTQKLYIINDRLCVALGGSGDQMYTFLRRVKAIYGDNNFDDIDLLRFIETYPKDESNDLIAIVLKSQQIDGVFDFAVRCVGNLHLIDNERYTKVVAGGSGAKQFLDFIQTNPTFATDISDTDALLVMNQYLISYWLGQEVARAESLLNHWGAGYEMIIFDNGRFVKLDEYTVVLLVGKFGKGIEFEAAPISTMMVNYQEDVLIIRVFANDEEKVFPVPSIINEQDSIEVVDIEPKHATLLITYILEDVDKNMQYFPTVVLPRNKNEINQSPIVFKRIGDKLQLYQDSRADTHVLNSIVGQLSE
jgi:hypothetical protein